MTLRVLIKHPRLGKTVTNLKDSDRQGLVVDCAYHQAEEPDSYSGFILLVLLPNGTMDEFIASDCRVEP